MQDIFSFILGGLIVALVISIIIKIIKIAFKSKTKKIKPPPKQSDKISDFKCLDGHVVKSKGELIIDNYLTILGIKHLYEKVISIKGKKVKCDWYLPQFDVYMEYWGYFGKKYNKRKKEKLKLYHYAHKKVISIENFMFFDVYSFLDKELKKIAKYKKTPKNIIIEKY